ncbi:MAG TPA: division/cell wall cluster transcriptional repressor MraZ [Ktedonobacteraceae bacterium]|nr:division/cell wall cluster transcriptional repressor MraZ [Ktedonobacteraceae bacterium]
MEIRATAGPEAQWSISRLGLKRNMFLGEYEHTIDSKGRMAVPARFRGQLDRGAVISKGMGTCLSVYTMQRWEEKSAELVAGKSSDELRDFERRIYPSASEIELDGQGRLVIPARLRAYAKLDSEVTVAGVRDHFEIWDRATWQQYQERLDAEGNTIPF